MNSSVVGHNISVHFLSFYDYSVKSPTSHHACMAVEEGLYDTPHNEEEVGQGSHGFRIVGRIVGAAMQRNNP